MASLLFILLLGLLSIAAAALPAYPDFYTVDSNNVLRYYSSADPSIVISSVTITGIVTGYNIIDIDFRPSNGLLYGVGKSLTESNTGNLYIIDPITGVATLVGPLSGCTLSAYSNPNNPYYGIDFDPVQDILRIVGQDTQNFDVNPATGECTKYSTLYYQAPRPSGRGPCSTHAVAYSNNVNSATSSVEYAFTSGIFVYIDRITACNIINREGVNTDGPFDIYSSPSAEVPLLISGNTDLRTVNLTSGDVSEPFATLGGTTPGAYTYGLAIELSSSLPTAAPTLAPTSAPTATPTRAPTAPPTSAPTPTPTRAPTPTPTSAPTPTPTSAPTLAPTRAPTPTPTTTPTSTPTTTPSRACQQDGFMRCAGTGFDTCNHGAFVFRPCAAGTVCKPNGDYIYCGFP